MLIVNTEQGPGSYEKHRQYFSSYSSFIFQMAECTAGISTTLVTPALCKRCLSHPELSQWVFGAPCWDVAAYYGLEYAWKCSFGTVGLFTIFLDVEDCISLGDASITARTRRLPSWRRCLVRGRRSRCHIQFAYRFANWWGISFNESVARLKSFLMTLMVLQPRPRFPPPLLLLINA